MLFASSGRSFISRNSAILVPPLLRSPCEPTVWSDPDDSGTQVRLPASPTEIVGVEFRAMARRRRGVRPGSPVAARHAGPRALPEERVIRADRDPQRQQCPAGSRSDTFGRTGIGNSLAGMMIVQATSTRPAYLGHAICICSLDRRTYRGLFRADRFTRPAKRGQLSTALGGFL